MHTSKILTRIISFLYYDHQFVVHTTRATTSYPSHYSGTQRSTLYNMHSVDGYKHVVKPNKIHLSINAVMDTFHVIVLHQHPLGLKFAGYVTQPLHVWKSAIEGGI